MAPRTQRLRTGRAADHVTTLPRVSALRLALAQVNPTVGDLRGNAELVLDRCKQAAAAGAHLVAFPEMVLTGYPVEDLALRGRSSRPAGAALVRLAAGWPTDGLADLPVVVGYLDPRPTDAAPASAGPRRGGAAPRGSPTNCAAVLHGGRVAGRYAKHHLPNYGVFDEYRYFVPGTDAHRRPGARRRRGHRDLRGPLAGGRAGRRRPATPGAGLLLVINGSPYERDKDDTRLELVRAARAPRPAAPLAYVNMVGGQDELVFDGDSLVVGRDGRGARPRAAVRRGTCSSSTWTCPVDRDRPRPAGGRGRIVVTIVRAEPLDRVCRRRHPPMHPRLDRRGRGVRRAGRLGLRDYVRKNGFRIGAARAVRRHRLGARGGDRRRRARRRERRTASRCRARTPSEHSGTTPPSWPSEPALHYRVVPIAPMVDAFLGGLELTGLAEENLQARVRGVI